MTSQKGKWDIHTRLVFAISTVRAAGRPPIFARLPKPAHIRKFCPHTHSNLFLSFYTTHSPPLPPSKIVRTEFSMAVIACSRFVSSVYKEKLLMKLNFDC